MSPLRLLAGCLLGILSTTSVWAGDTKNAGWAHTLEGPIDTWIIFVSTPTDPWRWKERWMMIRLLKRAEKWIVYEQTQAMTSSSPIKFRNHRLTRWRNVERQALPAGTRSGTENVELVNDILPNVGYVDSQDFLRHHPTGQHQMVLFLKRSGASYAIPQESDLSKRYDLEGIVLYQDFAPDTPQCASCIAHEILHVFGAWDFYPTFQTSQAQFDAARTRFPDSVMLRTSYQEYELMIDPVTQWRVGWGPKPADAESFTPSR